MERVAVIIPLFNHEAYIGEAVASVFAQSRLPARLIILDDGSRDGSVAVARKAVLEAPAGIAVEVLEQTNAGAHAALNRAVSIVEDCDIVAILNSDDRFLPGRLERALARLAAEPANQILCTGLRLIGPDGRALPAEEPRWKWFDAVWSLARAFEQEEISLPEWLGVANFPATTSNFVARRAWLLQHPFRNYRYAHDYFALVEAAVEGVLMIDPEVELEYRVHPSNTITTAPEKLATEMLRVNLDLAVALAPKLAADQGARARWAAYQRAAWASVSAFRQDLFQTLVAGLLERLPAGAISEAVDRLSTEALPELGEFPNKPLVNLRRAGEELGRAAALAEKIESLKRERASLKDRLHQITAQKTMLEQLARSPWVRIGRTLGLVSNNGSNG